MLTAVELTAIDRAVQEVARQGFGLVTIVVEHGKPVRLQQQVDVQLKKLCTPASTNSSTAMAGR